VIRGRAAKSRQNIGHCCSTGPDDPALGIRKKVGKQTTAERRNERNNYTQKDREEGLKRERTRQTEERRK
jgi:hypothetical protein